ncbi:MAG: hypothetical protein Q4D17_08225, partial [Planctomycetia bacterium]|nr:hypothetical protein [Planctomycetia bacterium]
KSIDDQYYKDLEDLKNKHLNTSAENVERDRLLKERERQLEEENIRHAKAQGDTRIKQTAQINDENYQNQLAAFGDMEMLYETYTGKTGDHSEAIVNAFKEPLKFLPEETKEKFKESMQGAIDGCSEKESSLFDKAKSLASGFIGTFTRIFDIHSPSRRFRKMFRQNFEGAELGSDDEKGKLLKQADDIGETYVKRMKIGLDKSDLIAKMRAGIDRGKSLVAQTLSAKVVHDVDISSENNNRIVVLKGDIKTAINIDGRETAIALTPYVSEELAYEEVFA